MVKIYPSLMAGNLVNLEADIQRLEPHCDGFHLDVMDFHFVPNLTFGPDMVNAIRRVAHKRLWVHLMVDAPTRYIPLLQLHEGDGVAFHYEHFAERDIRVLCKELHARKLLASLALKPHTAIEVVKPFFGELDHVLLMSVEPGFSGQSFLPESYKRLEDLCFLRDEHNVRFVIAMDGGINAQNLPELVRLGVDDIGVASAVFGASDQVQALKQLKEIVNSVEGHPRVRDY